MRGEEDKLHAADEIGAGHHHEGGVAERDLDRDAAEVLPMSSADDFGSGILSTPPANQAAGISATDRIRNRRARPASHSLL